ncbi:hypothetical protein Ahy_B10g102387 [Arachis hypogaea]|uniref:Uncharacterized protein n=1 Tax=Arachis hypogaea TaxID=3818 RepID=A0A444X1R0_ARAHY|nr:hypothetical protein Ahy_B10g102387 [Arachis hypogaea]
MVVLLVQGGVAARKKKKKKWWWCGGAGRRGGGAAGKKKKKKKKWKWWWCRAAAAGRWCDGGPSTMFGFILNYVVLRLLSDGPNDGGGDMEKAPNWIQSHGGVTYITS